MALKEPGKVLGIEMFILAEFGYIEKIWLFLSMIACVTDEGRLDLYVEITANSSDYFI